MAACLAGVSPAWSGGPLTWRRTRGSFRVHVSELDFSVEPDTPLLDFADPRSGGTEARIGAHVAPLVHDGDTLQFGIGAVPAALARALTGHRRLRFHGGMLPSALQTLWEAGTIDRDARITTGVVPGDGTLRDFAARLEALWLTDAAQTHGAAALAAIPRLVAINTAVEVDLFGQISSERAGGVIQAGAGGLPAFAQGTLASPGGRLLISACPLAPAAARCHASCRRWTRRRCAPCRAPWPRRSSPNTAWPSCAACCWTRVRRR